MKMLRYSGPIGLAALALLSGCELFSTREFSPKPADVATLQGLSRPGDSVAFRVTESLQDAGAPRPTKILARKRVRFTLLGDSSIGGETWRAFAMRISDENGGAILEDGVRLLRVGPGLDLHAPAGDATPGGGARFYPMKVAAAGDSAFKALPPLFADGLEWEDSLGILKVTRNIEGTDTLAFQGRLEESWRVAEKVYDGARVLSNGDYWYGASGLIRASQTWGGFEGRANDGSAIAKASLRRDLERL